MVNLLDREVLIVLFKLSSQLHKQIIPIRVLIFFTVFASSGAEAVMSCQLSGGGISGPDPNVLGQADCSRIGGSFNTISIDDSELTGYFTYSIYCDYNGYSNSSRGGGCSVTDFFADKETIEKEAKNSADNPNQCSTDGPINTVTGNKHKTHVDIDSNSPAFFKPEFTRIYNSSAVSNRDFVIGKNWLHSYQRSLQLLDFVNSKLRDPGNVNHSPSNFSTPANACTGGVFQC